MPGAPIQPIHTLSLSPARRSKPRTGNSRSSTTGQGRRRGRLQTDLGVRHEVLAGGSALYDAGGWSAVEKGSGGTDPWGRPTGVPKGGDVSVTVTVPLEDMYVGGRVRDGAAARCVPRMRGQAGPPRPYAGGDGREVPWLPAVVPAGEEKVVQRRMGMMIMNQEVEEPSKERCKEDARS